MIKFDFELDLDAKEITQALEKQVDNVMSKLSQLLESKARALASRKLKSGLKHWHQGFKTEWLPDGTFVMAMEGQLPLWMEGEWNKANAINPGEISDSIMQGNRANYNKSLGKDYVDVPISKDADEFGNISYKDRKGNNAVVNVSAFSDADQMKKYLFSRPEHGGVRRGTRAVQRVNDLIKSTKPSSGSTSYLTIRRVTKKSNWPASPVRGARVFEDLKDFLDNHLDSVLERIL